MSEVGYTQVDLLQLSELGLEVGASFALSVSVGYVWVRYVPLQETLCWEPGGFR